MFAGRKRSFNSAFSRAFSSASRSCDSCSARRSFTACAIIEAMIVSSRTSCCRSAAGSNARSALSVPATSCSTLIGTQMNEVSGRLPRCVLSRNSGDSLVRGITLGLPLSATCPVTPSPSL